LTPASYTPDHASLFRHLTADKAAQYRAIMDAFARAARQF